MPTADNTKYNLSHEEESVGARWSCISDRVIDQVLPWTIGLRAEKQIREQEERAIDEASEESFRLAIHQSLVRIRNFKGKL